MYIIYLVLFLQPKKAINLNKNYNSKKIYNQGIRPDI